MPVRKIRAVLDTNILVSGIISPKGASRKILNLARKEVFKVVTSISINHEFFNVLHRAYIYTKYNLTETIIDDMSAFLYEGAILTEDHYNISRVKKTRKTINLSRLPLRRSGLYRIGRRTPAWPETL